MGAEDSNDDAVITEVKKKVKVWCENGRTAGDREDVNVINVYGVTRVTRTILRTAKIKTMMV